MGMDHPSIESLQQAWLWRAAVKRFDPARKLPQEEWEFLLDVIASSPSSYGLQPYRVVEVRGEGLRQNLSEASFGQVQVIDADRLLVFATVDDFGESEVNAHLERLRTIRGLPSEAIGSYRAKVMERIVNGLTPVQKQAWQAKQAYIALGALMWAAAQRGIDTCPLEAIDPVRYGELLDLPWKGLTAVVACAVGYRSQEETYASQAKVRMPREELILAVEG
jgi:nitroreductase